MRDYEIVASRAMFRGSRTAGNELVRQGTSLGYRENSGGGFFQNRWTWYQSMEMNRHDYHC